MATGLEAAVLGGGGGATPPNGGDATSGATGASGPASGHSSSGNKVFNIGGNPNVKAFNVNNAGLMVVGLIALWLLTRKNAN